MSPTAVSPSSRRARKGALSPKTYFPILNDQLIEGKGTLWRCVRANQYADDEVAVRYALLVGYAGQERHVMTVSDTDSEWLSGIQTIIRKTGHIERAYHLNPDSATWQEAGRV